MKQCALWVFGLLFCLASQGLSRPDLSLRDLESALEESYEYISPSKISNYKCDCYVRLEVNEARAEWFCSASSDLECQSVSLEELQDLVQTEAEAREWKRKQMQLLAKDMTVAKPCVCSVKIGQADAAVEYYCNGLSCYMLAAEISSKNIVKKASWMRRECVTNPNYPCCRCVNNVLVCSDSHCPVLPCPPEQQQHTPGECCPSCQEQTEPSVQSVEGSCPYYSESTLVMNTFVQCGCHLECLREKCESME